MSRHYYTDVPCQLCKHYTVCAYVHCCRKYGFVGPQTSEIAKAVGFTCDAEMKRNVRE